MPEQAVNEDNTMDEPCKQSGDCYMENGMKWLMKFGKHTPQSRSPRLQAHGGESGRGAALAQPFITTGREGVANGSGGNLKHKPNDRTGPEGISLLLLHKAEK